VLKLLKEKASSGTQTHISSANSCCATTNAKTQNHHYKSITGHKKLKKLDNVKIGNLKKKNKGHNPNKMKTLVTYKFYYIYVRSLF